VNPVSSSKWNKATEKHALKYVSANTKVEVINLENKFAVISTGKNSREIYKRKAMELGLIKRLAYSSGINVAVLKLTEEKTKVRQYCLERLGKL